MTRVIPTIEFPTPAGTIRVPTWMEPCLPPTDDDLAALRRHMLIVGCKEVWPEWSELLGVGKVYDVRTLSTFFHLWMLVCRRAAELKCDISPTDEMGFMVYEQKFVEFSK